MSQKPSAERYVSLADGGRLFYEERGRGPVVILIHGGNLDARMWDEQFEPFARSFRTIRYDVRPYGRSSAPTVPYSAHADLRALFDALGVERASLVGLSLGGRIAVDFALSYPDRVDKLVLAGPGLSGFTFAADPRFKEMFDAASAGDVDRATALWQQHPYMAPAMEQPRLAEQIRRIGTANRHIWTLKNYEQTLDPPATARLQDLRMPVLLVVGSRDVADIHRIVELLGKQLKDSATVRIDGAGHMVNMERPTEFNEAALAFLRGRR